MAYLHSSGACIVCGLGAQVALHVVSEWHVKGMSAHGRALWVSALLVYHAHCMLCMVPCGAQVHTLAVRDRPAGSACGIAWQHQLAKTFLTPVLACTCTL